MGSDDDRVSHGGETVRDGEDKTVSEDSHRDDGHHPDNNSENGKERAEPVKPDIPARKLKEHQGMHWCSSSFIGSLHFLAPS